MSQEGFCTLLVQPEGVSPSAKELKEALEKGDIATKQDTIKKLIALQVNGEPQNHLIMSVIKYCVPVEDHTLKKLLMYFWETVDKTDATGKLLPEMILLCSFIRNDLQHPNEFIRGATLRFLCKMRERDILEPVTSTVLANLSHRVSYVRRNAVLCVHMIYQRFPQLIPDAPERIEKFFSEEEDGSAKRHALNMLLQAAPERALKLLVQLREAGRDSAMNDALQLAVVEAARQLIQSNPSEKPRLVPLIFLGLESKNPGVLFAVSQALVSISTSPTAVKAASSTLIQLLSTNSDNNVRLVVLERLIEMKGRFLDVLQGQVMELLRALNGGTNEARQKIIDFALELITPRNVEAVVQLLKKELQRSQSDEAGDAAGQQEYRQHVVRAMHRSVMSHLDIAPSVMPIMLEYLCEPGPSAYDVVVFVREVLQAQPQIRTDVLERLAQQFQMITSARVLRAVLWLFSVHASTPEQVALVAGQIKAALEPLPLEPPKVPSLLGAAAADAPVTTAVTTVREDGTYITTIAIVNKRTETERSDLTGLRSQICSGDHFLSAAVGITLAKLVASLWKFPVNHAAKAAIQQDALDIIRELIRYGTSRQCPQRMDEDTHEHLCLASTLVSNPKNELMQTLVRDTIEAFDRSRAPHEEAKQNDSEKEVELGDCFAPLVFSQLSKGKQALAAFEATDDVGMALSNDDVDPAANDFLKKLHRVVQLSGFSDPIYCEGTLSVHQFDVTIDLTLVNQTPDTLTNVTVELATTGELKLCERPQAYMLPPNTGMALKIPIKVSSTEAGSIYGSVVFDSPAADRQCVYLSEIHIDIMDYIFPAKCSLTEFRDKWTVYDWENSVPIVTELKSMRQYVEQICKIANMAVLEPNLPNDDCGVLSASLYARSSFGDDVVVNVCAETMPDGTIAGNVRMRSKTKGIACSLGILIEAKQNQIAAASSTSGGAKAAAAA